MSDNNWLCKIWGRPWTCTVPLSVFSKEHAVICVCIVLHPIRWNTTWDDRSWTGRCAATCKRYTVVHQGFEKCQVLGRVLESISRGLHRVTVRQNDRSVHSRTHRRDRHSFQESPEQASLTGSQRGRTCVLLDCDGPNNGFIGSWHQASVAVIPGGGAGEVRICWHSKRKKNILYLSIALLKVCVTMSWAIHYPEVFIR